LSEISGPYLSQVPKLLHEMLLYDRFAVFRQRSKQRDDSGNSLSKPTEEAQVIQAGTYVTNAQS
jgi:hypothetical protein